MSKLVRRLGFGAALATGLSLLTLSATGMAALDGDLRAAAEQQQTGTHRVVLQREHIEPCHDHAVGRAEL
ncbi:MAG TPA: hypothetical protein VF549_01540 [Solirubrobacteraceae bacterium]|jgi:hypothetical protein